MTLSLSRIMLLLASANYIWMFPISHLSARACVCVLYAAIEEKNTRFFFGDEENRRVINRRREVLLCVRLVRLLLYIYSSLCAKIPSLVIMRKFVIAWIFSSIEWTLCLKILQCSRLILSDNISHIYIYTSGHTREPIYIYTDNRISRKFRKSVGARTRSLKLTVSCVSVAAAKDSPAQCQQKLETRVRRLYKTLFLVILRAMPSCN